MNCLQLLYFIGFPLTPRREFEFHELLKQCEVDSLENNQAIRGMAMRALKASGGSTRLEGDQTAFHCMADRGGTLGET
jgi:hypothetical protein